MPIKKQAIVKKRSTTKDISTHLEQLIAIDDPLKRAFYEIECIRGQNAQLSTFNL